jgi:hypothetical protein
VISSMTPRKTLDLQEQQLDEAIIKEIEVN